MIKKLLIYLLAAVLGASAAAHVIMERPDQTTALGVREENTYTNETLGIGCTLEGWTFHEGAVIGAFNTLFRQALQSALRETDALSHIGDIRTILLGESRNQLQVVAILLADVDQEPNLEISDAMIESLKSTFENQEGVKAVSVGRTWAQMGQEQWNGEQFSYNLNGVNYYGKMFPVYRPGKLYVVLVGSYVTDATDRVLKKITPLA